MAIIFENQNFASIAIKFFSAYNIHVSYTKIGEKLCQENQLLQETGK